ncbi:MAG: PqqD family protein [Caldilineaceae bacterium]|nr:PqqD family protein [Caldilineaceae bacterium]MBP8107215.1 PqqD family protein [Caldilineaceae bacterium]MBP8122250.1 PqqD family protein [Caldilineaceae bacterium]MBP9072821.1 PqqD family protein [Caldilineaceae bacterium]
MLTYQTIPTPKPDVIGQRMEEEAVIVTAASGTVKVLNDVGARIWELADGQRTVADMAAIIATEYTVTPAQALADTLAFVDELIARGIFAAPAGQ